MRNERWFVGPAPQAKFWSCWSCATRQRRKLPQRRFQRMKKLRLAAEFCASSMTKTQLDAAVLAATLRKSCAMSPQSQLSRKLPNEFSLSQVLVLLLNLRSKFCFCRSRCGATTKLASLDFLSLSRRFGHCALSFSLSGGRNRRAPDSILKARARHCRAVTDDFDSFVRRCVVLIISAR